MAQEKSFNSTSRTLRLAIVTELVFLAAAGFFLFTEHRAHYLGVLPYALIVVSVTACFWLQAETRKHLASLARRPRNSGNPGKGVESHEP